MDSYLSDNLVPPERVSEPLRLRVYRYLHSGSRKKIANNIAWLCVDKSLAILDSLLVGAAVARYLGPDQLGIIAFATAITAILTMFVSLGLDGILTKSFVIDPSSRGRIFWSFAWNRFLLASICFLGIVVASVSGWFGQSSTTIVVLLLMATTLLASPLSLCRLLLDAEVSAKWHVWISNIALLVTASTKILLILFNSSMVAFAVASTVTNILVLLALFEVVRRLGLIPKFEFPVAGLVATQVRECWPLLVGSLSIALYMNADIVMLQILKNPAEAGIYSVASRLSSVWYFIPLAISTSLMPSLTRLNQSSKDEYKKQLQRYLDVSALASYVCIAIALLIVPGMVHVLFGEKFGGSIPVFYYHIWAMPFVFLGVARSQHLILESLHGFNMITSLLGITSNLLLNWLLIPGHGAKGAAIATIASYAISAYLSSFLFEKLRPIGRAQTISLISAPWRLYRQIST